MMWYGTGEHVFIPKTPRKPLKLSFSFKWLVSCVLLTSLCKRWDWTWPWTTQHQLFKIGDPEKLDILVPENVVYHSCQYRLHAHLTKREIWALCWFIIYVAFVNCCKHFDNCKLTWNANILGMPAYFCTECELKMPMQCLSKIWLYAEL